MAKQKLFSISSIQLGIIKTNPPKLDVTVSGLSTTSGWSNAELVPLEKKLSADGILDLDFVAEPPNGLAFQSLSPIIAHLVWEGDVERLVGVKVYSRSEDKVQLLNAKLSDEAVSDAADKFLTTLAIGEEGNIPTTFAIGEEGGPFTTLAVGEEGGTTFIFGEEGPSPKPFFGETDPRADDPLRTPDPRFFPNVPRNPFGRR